MPAARPIDERRRLIVGRGDEIERVRRLVDGDDAHPVLLLEGEAGIGKTTLLDVAATRATERGLVVLRAAAEDLAADRPFGLLARALAGRDDLPEALSHEIADLTSASARHDPAGALASGGVPARVIDWALDQIEGRATAAGALLVLDDIQWADPHSVLALGPLLRRSRDLRLGAVIGLRPEPRTPALDRLVESLGTLPAQHFRLGPLRAEEVDVLVGLHAGGPASDRLRALAAGAGGNPFYVSELVAALADDGRLTTVDGVVEVGGDALPESVRRTLSRRARMLGDDVYEVLQAAAILGRTLRLDEIAPVVGRPPGALAPLLRPAVNAGVLVDDGGLRFRHDLLREALLEETPRSVRGALHRQVHGVLRASGAGPQRVARHLLLGMAADDADGLAELLALASQLPAPDAADLLADAMERCAPSPTLHGALISDLAAALVWSGRPADAARLVDDALGWVDDPRRLAELRATRSHALFLLGDPRAAFETWEAARADHPIGAGELAEVAMARLFAGDLNGARTRATEALTRDIGPADAALAYGVLAWVAATAGDLDGALETTRAAASISRSLDGAALPGYTGHLFLAVVLDALGRTDEAIAALAEERRLAGSSGSAAAIVTNHAIASVVYFRSGAWDEALATADAGIELSREAHVRLVLGWLIAVKVHVLLSRGAIDEAERALDDAPMEGYGPQLGLEWLGWARARVMEAHGAASAGGALVASLIEVAEAMGVRSASSYLGPEVVRLSLDDAELVARTAERLAWIGDGHPDTLRAAAMLCRAAAMRDGEAAAAAAARFAGIPRPWDAAHAHHIAAVLFAASGAEGRARDEANHAAAHYGELGADAEIARLRADLRAHDVRLRLATPARDTKGWESLTPTERTVVELVAEGLPNAAIAERLFVSRRTVESHLARVYPKIGIRSRVELAKLVAERAATSRAATS